MWVAAALVAVLYLGGFALMPVSSAAFTATTTGPASSFAARSTFGFTQTAPCFSSSGSGGCPAATGIVGGASVVVSPDGKHVYSGSVAGTTSSVAAFSRNATTGALTQLASPDRCYSNAYLAGCTTVQDLLLSVYDLAISPDGKHVYAVSFGKSTLVAFSRNATTGVLTKLSGTNGCRSDESVTPVPTGCISARGMTAADGVVVSPDGAYVYVAGHNSHSIAVFARNSTTGVLTQLSGTSGCYADSSTQATGCTETASGMRKPYYVRTSPDGRSVYVAGNGSNAVAIFQRNMTTGALSQPAGPNKCVHTNGNGTTGCTAVKGLSGAYHLGVSPDGAHVYALGNTGGTVASFTRNTTTGVLTQLGTNGCLAAATTSGCTTVRAIVAPTGIDFSRDGLFAFVSASGSNAVAVFRRDSSIGVLTQPTDTSGCIALPPATGGCTTGDGLSLPGGIATSPDGRDVYVAGGDGAAGNVTVLNLTH
ncbi:hypothetical protein BG844_06395 [Couchioplanes caeruleus subsp. caeruleus]|uniref:6-phosphogluconolactonase (Cycloisomerase 2 family) n=1 Tax=Couchioplanes caeruleus subsp. caeruleus TaxID=56427 RepID=A0A1K0FQH4_9ACTN|nr:hypothetical protein BG844_06395 [Couchioplanes caeruleus subsp. caeruleus]